MRKCLMVACLSLASVAHAGGFTLKSPDVGASGPIADKHVFKGFGCEGGDVSPALSWESPPKNSKSFALTVYDPDAPTGSGWWHWVVLNLPPETKEIPQGAGDPAAAKLPKGALQTRTDYGKPGWGGPCPPLGDKPHRYVFTLHALKVDKIELAEDAPAAMAGYMINANSLGKASFTARYGRAKK